MPDRNFCKQQIQRMAGMDYFPTFAPAITELLETLMETTRDEQHAKAVVDECVRQHGCPEPADLRLIARNLQPVEPPSCDACHGSGYVSEVRLIGGIPHDYARRCGCNPARSAQ